MAVLLCVAVFAGSFLIAGAAIRARADRTTVTAWVICQPGDYVNARTRATKSSAAVGMYETGDAVELDGKTSNGYAHIVDVGLEVSEAWIHTGYIVFDEPEWVGDEMTVVGNGRVAARKYAEGPVRTWLKPFSYVQVFWMTEDWAVTNRGFIKTEYLEVGTL